MSAPFARMAPSFRSVAVMARYQGHVGVFRATIPLGIDVDDVEDIVFTLRRASNQLYIYRWEPLAVTLTLSHNRAGANAHPGFDFADEARLFEE